MSQRVNLTVPYAEKEDAKKLGAKWDPKMKVWYCINDNPLLLRRWGSSIESNSVERQEKTIENDVVDASGYESPDDWFGYRRTEFGPSGRK